MTTYSIKAPDGNTYQIDGPEGASDAEVRAAVLEQHPDAGTGVTLMDLINGNPVMGAAAGVLKSGAQNIYGLKDLAGKVGISDGLDDEDRQNLAALSQIKSGSATAGQMVGNIGMMAIPGKAAGGILSALPSTMAARGLTMAGADVAANAGMGAIAMPEAGQTRGGNAALSALGSGIGSTLGAAVKGVPSAAFQSFMDFADKVVPQNLKSLIGYGPGLGALHHVAPSLAYPIDAAMSALTLARTDAGKAFATGATRAQQALQRGLPGTIDYLSQVGAGAAEGAND